MADVAFCELPPCREWRDGTSFYTLELYLYVIHVERILPVQHNFFLRDDDGKVVNFSSFLLEI